MTKSIVEALLFAANAPLSLSRLAQIVGKDPLEIIQAIETLNQDYEATGRTFRIHQVSAGYQLYTQPDYGQWVRSLFEHTHRVRLSKPSLEVLAIIAYEQPTTKPEIEKLRGIDSAGPIMTLLDRKLIQIEGRAKRPGSPFLYRTTKEFLRYFGLNDLADLPRKEDLEEFLSHRRSQIESESTVLTAIGDMANQSTVNQTATEPTTDNTEAAPSDKKSESSITSTTEE
jgi:segregation and condensation protein B